LGYLLYSPVFKNARIASEQVHFKRTKKGLETNLPVIHDTIRSKKDVKAVSGKVQVPPLLRQRHNADTG